MQYIVRRAKHKYGTEMHDKSHAADNYKTACGKDLDDMWFVESDLGDWNKAAGYMVECALCENIFTLKKVECEQEPAE